MSTIEKIFPETLLQLMLDVLVESPAFKYIEGIQPFSMIFSGQKYYVYVKNLSSAYFKERPDTTRAQLPIKEEFYKIKLSPHPFIFLGYDQENDVLVCWNYHVVKARLNERKSVSFYSRKFFQDEIVPGEIIRKKLKNGDEPILFKRNNLVEFFSQIDTFFQQENTINNKPLNPYKPSEKILHVTETDLIDQIRPVLEAGHTFEAMKMAEKYYIGKYPAMKPKDWLALVKGINLTATDNNGLADTSAFYMPENETYKRQFMEFMRQDGKSESTIRRYVRTISLTLTPFIKKLYFPQLTSLFNTADIALLNKWSYQLQTRPDFIEQNMIHHWHYSCALNKYLEFAESLNMSMADESAIAYHSSNESEFVAFMQSQGLSARTISNYIYALQKQVTEGIRKHIDNSVKNVLINVNVNQLNNWFTILFSTEEYIGLDKRGKNQYSCALKKYIDFVRSISQSEDPTKIKVENYNNEDIKSEFTRQKLYILRVTYPNGRIVEEKKVYKTLIDVVETAGVENVRKLGIILKGFNLISDKIILNYENAQKPLSNGALITTCCDTATKQKIIERISNILNLSLKIERVFIV